MADEPENLVLQMLRGIRAEVAEIKSQMAMKADTATTNEVADLRAEVRSLRADVASDFLTMLAKADAEHKATRDAVREQISGLRLAVFEYLSSIVGHGVLIGELGARMRRVEKHLDLPPIDTN